MDADIEPIRRAPSAQLGYLKMYREDVDQLLDMFQQACQNVTISDQKHRYKNLDAMRRTVPSPIKEFTIRGKNPDLVFLFNRTEIVTGPSAPTQKIFNELRTDISTDAADALFYKIKDFLLRYQRPTFRKGFLVGAIAAILGLFWVFLHYAFVDHQGQIKLAPRSILPMLLCFLGLAISLGLTFGGTNYLSLEKRRDAPSFFARNREEFATRAVSTGIASLVSGIIGYFIGHYLK